MVKMAVAQLEPNQILLVTAGQLDRERTPSVSFQLTCTIQPAASSSPLSSIILTQNVSLAVLDEDDNPPRFQSRSPPDVIHHVYLKDQGIAQEKDILPQPFMILDDDTDKANRFRLNLSVDGEHPLSSLIKLESPVWSLADTTTRIPRSVMAVGK